MSGTPTTDAYRHAAELFHSGDPDGAARACQALVASAPGHFDAWYLLGVIDGKRGHFAGAEHHMRKALECDPASATAHANLGLALQRLGRLPEAVQHLGCAIGLDPSNSDALSNCANAMNVLGKPAEALAMCERALAINPRHLHALNNRGAALARLGNKVAALQSYDEALAIDAAFLPALGNRGLALEEAGQYDDALAAYRVYLSMEPESWDAHNNIGNALRGLGRLQEALEAYSRALESNPAFLKALNNRGLLRTELGCFEEALADFDAAIAADPQYVDAYWNKSLCLLTMGDYSDGWRLYEWRWKNAALKHVARDYDYPQPLWLGAEDLAGKSIFLHAEQGLGDAIQFARYVPLVAAKGASVTLGMFHTVAPLMEGLKGVARLLRPGDAPPLTDFHCPLMSLPLALGTTLETIPAEIPYLRAQPELAREWRAKLERKGEKTVGICWRGSPGYGKDAQRSIRFAEFSALLSVPGVRFVSLQKELLDDERQRTKAMTNWEHPGADFLSTAALVGALDLVIAVDTAWVHWAGAIGKPVWVLLPYVPHWAWLTQREDSPWYPTARLFRQTRRGDWQELIDKVRRCLHEYAHQSAGSPAPRGEDSAIGGRPS